MLKKLLVPVTILIISCFSISGFCEKSKEDLLGKIESLYKTYNDMKAEFVQEAYNATSESRKKAAGLYFAKKPNLMRWEYKEPDEQLFVFDGKFLWFYTVQEKQVIKSNIDNSDSGMKMFIDFLSSLKKIEDDFTITTESKDNLLKLALTPKKDMSGLSVLNVYLNPKTFELVKTEQIDQFDNKNTISFQKIEVNKGLKEDLFKFQPPAGVEVIEN
jgi:outer membrane lipoprotein carrier protein